MQMSQHILVCHSMVVKMVLSNQTSYQILIQCQTKPVIRLITFDEHTIKNVSSCMSILGHADKSREACI